MLCVGHLIERFWLKRWPACYLGIIFHYHLKGFICNFCKTTLQTVVLITCKTYKSRIQRNRTMLDSSGNLGRVHTGQQRWILIKLKSRYCEKKFRKSFWKSFTMSIRKLLESYLGSHVNISHLVFVLKESENHHSSIFRKLGVVGA